MKLNSPLTHSLSILLLILLLVAGCSEEMTDPDIPEIATVKIEFTLPSPPPPSEPVGGPFCKAGDILRPGESCFYPGTDIELSVLDDGVLKIHDDRGLNMFLHGGVNLENFSINGTPITLIGNRHNDNSWKIEKIGRDAGTLDVTVSTDTTHEFALTESFSQDFPLDPDDPRLSVTIRNNTPDDLFVHYTILFDGDVQHDERRLLGKWAIMGWEWSRSITNE